MEHKTPVAAKSTAPLSSNLLSSPPRLSSSRGKERRNPSITPRKFRQFFTPRSRVSSKPSAARRALRDLTAPSLNRCHTPSSPLKPISESDVVSGESAGVDSSRALKRRKTNHIPATSPLQPAFLNPSPTLLDFQASRPALLSPLHSPHAGSQSSRAFDAFEDGDFENGDFDDESDNELPLMQLPIRRLTPLTSRGMSGQLVQRMTGGMPRSGHQSMSYPVADWRTETADFCSTPEDVHMCSSHEGAARCIPFCTASCHNNSLVAVGDEEGHVRLLDSNKSFDKIHLSFQVHSNAIIDLDFSEDDYVLATASGDQTGKVIDMMTQAPVSVLGHHTASLKQVRFQPGRGGGSVLATSSRDGSVQIWDLRCRGGPVQEISIERETALRYRLPPRINPGCVVNSVYDAHARTPRQPRQPYHQADPSVDIASRSEVPGRIGEVSVTAIQFLPAGREHLLLSACEADASIKLWDIRSIHTSRHHKSSTPISYTKPPDSHTTWRPFGMSSMALGSDGARLYALCKDNTVYAYSTSHLVLGHAPELSARATTEPPRRRAHGTEQEGLGPMYGFRHPLFHATSFYVKADVRPARDGRPELLAVGSSDGCAVLFPTDERYFRADLGAFPSPVAQQVSSPPTTTNAFGGRSLLASATDLTADGPPSSLSGPGQRRGLARANSMTTNLSARLVDTVPIVRNGTALVRGHDKEVGSLSWTSGGALVTVGDDYLVRCWDESRARATGLRRGGETGGQRWACGWADVGEEWVGDEDDW